MRDTNLIIFDLDGTLIDSSRDLAISTNATRAHFGLPSLEQATVNSYVGNGASVLVRRAMGEGASEAQVAEALDFFLNYYRANSIENTKLYPGIDAMLEELAKAHWKLGVLTNKPEKISIDILEALGVQARFFRIYGGNRFAQKKPDPTGLLQLSEEAGTTPARTLMVGDSKVDIETARNAGARSCGVTWGFQPETFEATRPDALIHAPNELLSLVS